jgi:hypothetical protein
VGRLLTSTTSLTPLTSTALTTSSNPLTNATLASTPLTNATLTLTTLTFPGTNANANSAAGGSTSAPPQADDGYGRTHWRRFEFGANGTHSTDFYAAEAVRVIEEHDPTQPLFLYLALQAPHSPTQAHAHDTAANGHIAGLKRRKFAGMVTGVDNGMRAVVGALRAQVRRLQWCTVTEALPYTCTHSISPPPLPLPPQRMWSNTLLWFLSDNGAELTQGGPN